MNMNSKRCGSEFVTLVLTLALVGSAWASSEKVLYRFHGKDGWGPTSVIVGPDGGLYGATVTGARTLATATPTASAAWFSG